MPKILIEAADAVVVTHQDGNYKSGTCAVCGACGELDEHFPHGINNNHPGIGDPPTDILRHHVGCEVGEQLGDDGKFK